MTIYDHRGNGRSSPAVDQTLTLEQLAGDADALRGMLGVSQIDILAHSVGGFVALTYALRYPQHLGRLILMNTAPAWDYGETIAARALAKGATANDLGLLDLSKCHEDVDLRPRICQHLLSLATKGLLGQAPRLFSEK